MTHDPPPQGEPFAQKKVMKRDGFTQSVLNRVHIGCFSYKNYKAILKKPRCLCCTDNVKAN